MKLHFHIFFICSVAEGCYKRLMTKLPTIKPPKTKLPTRLITSITPMLGIRYGYKLGKFAGFIVEGSVVKKKLDIEKIQAPQVCKDCYYEFEKIWEAIDEKRDSSCEKWHSLLPEQEWYDAENQNCTIKGAEYFYSEKGTEIFKDFGAENNKCLKAKSEYLVEMENDSKCREGNDLIQGDFLRCLYDTAYQPEEAKKSCETGIDGSESD